MAGLLVWLLAAAYIFYGCLSLDHNEPHQHEDWLIGLLLFLSAILLSALLLIYQQIRDPIKNISTLATALQTLGNNNFYLARQQLASLHPLPNNQELTAINRATVELTEKLEQLSWENIRQQEKISSALQEKSDNYNFLNSVVNTANVVFIVLDSHGTIIACNEYTTRLLNLQASNLLGRQFTDFFQFNFKTEQEKRVYFNFLMDLTNNRFINTQFESYLNLALEGDCFISWKINSFGDKDNNNFRVICIGMNITTRLNLERKIEEMAYLDPLTGIPNRREMNRLLGEFIQVKQAFSLLLIDINYFKLINDSFGHNMGDKYLIQFAHVLQKEISNRGYVGRNGGDEFFVIIPQLHATDIQTAEAIAQQLINRASEVKISHDRGQADGQDGLSISIGISCYPEHSEKAEELIVFADTAMYENKQARTSNFRFYSGTEDMMKRLSKTKYWNDILDRSLKEHKLGVYYQAIFDTQQQKTFAYEALARILDAQNEQMYAAGSFIDSIESASALVKLDQEMIETIFRQLSLRAIEEKIFINLSTLTINHHTSLEHIMQAIQKFGIDSNSVVFEITEQTAIKDIEATETFMRTLNAIGIQFALDDFGQGYSSLFVMTRLPINYLKIDKSFVYRVLFDRNMADIIKVITDFCHIRHIKVIAEGIESIEQMEAVSQLGVDYLQGFHIGKPQKHPYQTEEDLGRVISANV